jgi:uncharacterized protein YbjQ (UPF0145 family)
MPFPKRPYELATAHDTSATMVTTANGLDGFRVVHNLGVVRGLVVRSRSVIGQIGAGFQMLFGGNISILTSLCEQARQDAFQLMVQHAWHLRANAIIAMRYDATELMPGATEVLCYGTAVVVEATGGGYRGAELPPAGSPASPQFP